MPARRRLPAPPFRVRTAGHVHDQPRHSTPGTKQGDVMLTVFLAGRGRYLATGERVEVERGFAGLAPPVRPGVLMADSADPYDHYYCRFGGAYAIALAGEIRAARRGRFFRCEQHAEVADLLRRMGRVGRRELPGRMGRAEALLAEALVLLGDPEEPERRRALSAEALERYLHDHIAEPLVLDRVAAHFALSKSALCRAAKRLAGRTVLDLAESIKIEWAGALLASGAANVAEAARRVGYEDPFYFSRVFRKRTGTPPREWMKRGARRRRAPR